MSATLATVSYIGASILFILSLGGLSNPETSRRGNLYGMIGMAIAVLATVFGPQVTSTGYAWIIGAMVVGGSVGMYAARVVKMTQMPELVALMHSLVGLDFPPTRSEPGRALAVGRLVEGKAPDLTLRAFAMAAGQFPGAHLDMVGAGPLQALCEAVIAVHGLEQRVTLHGARDHDFVAGLMSRAAMFVQHSVVDSTGGTEGFPTAISEAMCSQLPVVATRHSGIPEHVHDGVSGFLVAEGDVEGMAAAMARLLADPALAAEMGAAGRQHALAHLDRERAHQRLREIMDLDAMLETGRQPARAAVV
jgi:hypothetical protein